MHVWKCNFIDLHKVLWHFFEMRFPILSCPVDLSGFRSPDFFSLHVSLFEFSIVFLDITFSHLLNTEKKYQLNIFAFSLSTDVYSLFYCWLYQGSLLDAFQIFLNLTKLSLFKNPFLEIS